MHQGVGIDEVRVASAFNSIKRRAEHLQERGRTKNLNAAKAGTVARLDGGPGRQVRGIVSRQGRSCRTLSMPGHSGRSLATW